MIKLNVLLIDSDKLALTLMEKMLAPYKYLQLMGAYTDPNQVWATLESHPVDLIFLDIDMKYINGLEVASRLGRLYSNAELVFVTEVSSYAVEAFNLNVMDYILKPIEQVRLDQSMTKLLRRIERRQPRLTSYNKMS